MISLVFLLFQILFLFKSGENILPDLYNGKIIIEGVGVKKEIPLIIEVESAEPLFDVQIKIPGEFLSILPGEKIVANIRLFEVGEIGKVDVEVEYKIVAEEGNEILRESEIVTVETQKSFLKTIVIPENAEEGNYIFHMKVTYNGKIASSSVFFVVEKIAILNLTKILLFSILLLMVIIVLYSIMRHKRHKVKNR